jgi:hypothetical protein
MFDVILFEDAPCMSWHSKMHHDIALDDPGLAAAL